MAEREGRAGDSRLEGRTVADRYLVQEKIGEGGMGEIYRARHLLIDKTVALKVLHPDRAGRRQALKRFQQEARAAARIGNLHIVDVTDYGFIDDDDAFLIMEYLEGESLAEAIARVGAFPAARVKAVAVQILDALEAAHEGGIVHRDLKSANVFLTRASGGDLVKLLDFGISKIFPTPASEEGGAASGSDVGRSPTWITDTGIMMGTPHYMAPEQAEESRCVDHRADLYSLGIILYEMLTGELPFGGTNIWNVLIKHANEEPQPPGERRPDLEIPRDLERVVLRALAKDPDDRYASAREMRQVMEAVVIESQPDAAAVKPPATPGARRVVLVLAGLAAMVAVAVVGLTGDKPPTPANEAAPKLELLKERHTDFPTKVELIPPAAADAVAAPSPDAGPSGQDLHRPAKRIVAPPIKRPRPPTRQGQKRFPQKSDIPPNPYDKPR